MAVNCCLVPKAQMTVHHLGLWLAGEGQKKNPLAFASEEGWWCVVRKKNIPAQDASVSQASICLGVGV